MCSAGIRTSIAGPGRGGAPGPPLRARGLGLASRGRPNPHRGYGVWIRLLWNPPPEMGTADMAKRLDRVLVIDIESTCWNGGYPPKGESNDVIEIGLCTLDLSTGRRVEKRSILVRP